MQVFELHFNPNLRKDVIFDTFYYEPEDIYEKRLGFLFLAGELTNTLPQNLKFLENLARAIKIKFYSQKTKTPQASLKASLKEANSFLRNIAKQGDVSWISNLNFAILNLSLISRKKQEPKYKLIFTKIKDIKILLARGGKVLDIGEDLKGAEIEPYPLKFFFNIASGKLRQEDRIFVMTNEVFEVFQQQKIIEKIANLIHLNEKNLNQVLRELKKDIFGFCLLISLEEAKEKKISKRLIFKEKISTQIASKFKKEIRGIFRKKIKNEVFSQRVSGIFGIFENLSKKIARVRLLLRKKNLILVLGLVFFLLLGRTLTQIEENRKISQVQTKLKVIQEELTQVDTLLILDQKEKANELLLRAFNETQSLQKTGVLTKEISQTKDNIKAKLFALNKIEIVETPELIFEFQKGEFLPEKIITLHGKIYFFNSRTENIFVLDSKNKSHLLEIKSKFTDATLIDDTILFFSKPNQIFPFKEEKFNQPFSLKAPFENFEFENLASFRSNLYFLDKKTGQIIKYNYLRDFEWQNPQFWLSENAKKAIGAKGMAIDGGIWVLQKDNLIERYYGGKLQKTIEVKIFPLAKNFSKIWTSSSLPYLYVLEPEQKRILILDKAGQIIKQYQSEKFDNIKDFAISEDGKTIYLLNDFQLYRINFL